jgi:LysM repeat protein
MITSLTIVKAAVIASVSLSGHGSVTVQAGDTLRSIAASHGAALSAVEAANPQISDPNLIYVGETVYVPSGGYVVPGHGGGDGDHDGDDGYQAAPAPVSEGAPAPQAPAPVTSPSSVGTVTGAPGSYQSCVITRESGGNPRAVNASSGAGGLYQFLPSTWAALGYGGLPQNAPVSVQNQAFQRLYAQDGTSPWSPSDGC